MVVPAFGGVVGDCGLESCSSFGGGFVRVWVERRSRPAFCAWMLHAQNTKKCRVARGCFIFVRDDALHFTMEVRQTNKLTDRQTNKLTNRTE